MILQLFLLAVLADWSQSSPLHQSCPTCEPEFCPKSAAECALGIEKDSCSCCPIGVCLLPVGSRCLDTSYISAISATDLGRYGSCGDAMECRYRYDLDPERDVKESICTCLENSPVCGSDNKTYADICSLRSALNSPHLSHSGPCAEAPRISVAPESGILLNDESLALDCEVHGVPVPAITWKFIAKDGATQVLPGDDISIVVQTRGGPESSMLTSWVQIMAVNEINAGTYICIAENSLGKTEAAAVVHVRTPM